MPIASSIVPDLGVCAYCFTTLPCRLSSTVTSVTKDVAISVRKNEPVFFENAAQQTAPCPLIGIAFVRDVEVELPVVVEFDVTDDEFIIADPRLRENVVAPTAGSVARSAFFPGIKAIPKG